MSETSPKDGPNPKPAAESADVLVLDGVSKSFGNVQAVHGVTFTVQRGEVFGFLGPNGAGKSTTIRLILDILRPTAGQISIFGHTSRDVKAIHKRIGYLSGDMSMDMNLTGEQYLTFVGAQYGKDCRQNMVRLAQALKADLKVKIGNYSRGNRQKVGLIAALQHEPELLIMDEPTSGFDPLVQELFAELIQIFSKDGGTVFMSSHILSEVQQLCDRVAFIKDGSILDVNTIDNLTENAAKRVRIKPAIDKLAELRETVKQMPGVRMQLSTDSSVVQFSYNGDANALIKLLARYDIKDLIIKEPDLEELFMHYYGTTPKTTPAVPAKPAKAAA